MSMFTIHYIIYNPEVRGYWNGKYPGPGCWTTRADGHRSAIGLYSKADARAVIDGVLSSVPNLIIQEDE